MALTVKRFHRPERYTTVSNEFMRAKIPVSAFRVACYLLSHAETYQMTQERIADRVGMGVNTVGTALAKLEELRYLARQPVRNELGHRTGTVLMISDRPFSADELASLTPDSEVRPTPSPESLDTESLTTESGAHKKTSSSKKNNEVQEDQSDQEILPDTSGDSEQASLIPGLEPTPKPDPLALFAQFYKLYPRHVGRKGAERAWLAAVRRGATSESIMEGCFRYAAERASEPKQYTKHPATWLNQDCWLDEPAPKPSATTGVTLNIDTSDYWDGIAAEEAAANEATDPPQSFF